MSRGDIFNSETGSLIRIGSVKFRKLQCSGYYIDNYGNFLNKFGLTYIMGFGKLCQDTLMEIARYLNMTDFIKLTILNRKCLSIFRDDYFWKPFLIRDFFSFDLISPSYHEIYKFSWILRIITDKSYIILGSFEELNLSFVFFLLT